MKDIEHPEDKKLYERAVIENPQEVLVYATAEFENSPLELKQTDLNFLEQIVLRENSKNLIQEKEEILERTGNLQTICSCLQVLQCRVRDKLRASSRLHL